MNEFDINIDAALADADAADIADANEIEIDGESFHLEDFEPTADEYRELVDGIYRSFYEEDVRRAIMAAVEAEREELLRSVKAELDEREKSIRDEARREVISKIAKRRLRPDENGLSGPHTAPKRDVSKMTKEERAAAAKRAAGGQLINLK